MKIRDATLNDAGAYRKLRQVIDGESDTWGADPGERFKSDAAVEEVINDATSQENSFLWLVEQNDSLIGFLHVKGVKWHRARHTVSLDIGLLDSACGRGLGDLLFEKLENWAGTHNILRIEFFVYEGNARARSFYRKWGYTEEGIRKGSIYVNAKLSNEIWMSKLLN